MNSSKENIIHRRQFQNANQIITVDVKSKPKLAIRPKVAHPTFKRNCALKNEIDKAKKHPPKLKALGNQQREARREKEPAKITSRVKLQRKLKEKCDPSNASWMEFLKAKNILPSDDVADMSTEKENTYGSISGQESLPVPINRRNMTVPKHLSAVKKHTDISLQCDMSQVAETVPLRYIHANQVSFKQRSHSEKLKEIPVHNIPSPALDTPKPLSHKIQLGEMSNNQTHTPFGESALRLIYQLREHLRSRGDSESSDLVNQLEAYIGGGVGSGNLLSGGKDEVFKFPSVPRYGLPTEPVVINNDDKIIIENQKQQIERLEKSNEELRRLSAKLLEYHQKVATYTAPQNIPADEQVPVKLSNKDKPKGETEGMESREGLELERDALLQKVQSQKDLIFNLEVKLEKNGKDLQRARKELNSVSGDSRKSANFSGFNSNSARNRSDLLANLLPKSLIRSDTDSAFDDRSVSLSDSKRSSPPLAGVEGPRYAAGVNDLAPRRVVAIQKATEDLSLTRRSDYPDDEGANGMLDNAFPPEVAGPAAKFHGTPEVAPAAYPGRVLESTRISSENLSPKPSKLSQSDDFSNDEYHRLQPELTTS